MSPAADIAKKAAQVAIEAEKERRLVKDHESRQAQARRRQDLENEVRRQVKKTKLGEWFPVERWLIEVAPDSRTGGIDFTTDASDPDVAERYRHRTYGECQPQVIITDERRQMFFGMTLNCSGTHIWWATRHEETQGSSPGDVSAVETTWIIHDPKTNGIIDGHYPYKIQSIEDIGRLLLDQEKP